MKKYVLICALALFSAGMLVYTDVNVQRVQQHTTNPVVKKQTKKDLRAFLRKMALRESDNTSTAVNKYGMMGKYQFHPSTVKVLGYKVSNTRFLASPALQDEVMVAYLKANRQELQPIIRRYTGKVVNGVRITESGILAGAHFAGSTGVLAFFYPTKYSAKLQDANGTHIKEYMRSFGGYTLF